MSTVYIAHATHDERGSYHGGSAGDQTGSECCIRTWYDRQWDCVIRFKNPAMREKVAFAMERGANNNNIGYDQWERNTAYYKARDLSWDLGAITKKCEVDCSSLVTIACIYAGVEASALFVSGNCSTTRELRKRLEKTGLVDVFVAKDYIKSTKKLMRGDILLNEGHHVAVVIAGNIKSEKSSESVVNQIVKCNSVIKAGQKESIAFTGVSIATDGIRGVNTKKQAVRVLQTALNKDYNAKLKVDGELGPKTKSALGNHYVARGERQYMVTCAEILYMLKGIDPKGVEYPGHFGAGLASASGTSKITASMFLKLLD